MSAYLGRALQSLASARRLVDDGDVDSAGSRVYFAVFNAVRATLGAVGVDPASSKTHQGTTRLFELHLIKAGHVDQSVSTALYQAAELRWHSDYASELVVSEDQVRRACDRADLFIQACRRVIESRNAPP